MCRIFGGLLDLRSKSADRIGEFEKLFSVKMESYGAIRKMEFPALAQCHLRLPIAADHVFHCSSPFPGDFQEMYRFSGTLPSASS